MIVFVSLFSNFCLGEVSRRRSRRCRRSAQRVLHAVVEGNTRPQVWHVYSLPRNEIHLVFRDITRRAGNVFPHRSVSFDCVLENEFNLNLIWIFPKVCFVDWPFTISPLSICHSLWFSTRNFSPNQCSSTISLGYHQHYYGNSIEWITVTVVQNFYCSIWAPNQFNPFDVKLNISFLFVIFNDIIFMDLADELENIENIDFAIHDCLTFILIRGLHTLLEYEGEDVEDVFCLSFIVSREVFGDIRTDELKPNGADIPVTQKNK